MKPHRLLGLIPAMLVLEALLSKAAVVDDVVVLPAEATTAPR